MDAQRSAVAADLAALPLLAGSTPEQIQALAHHLRPEVAAAGRVLGREGEAGDEFWLVIEGALDVMSSGPDGVRKLATAGPGAIVGELAVLRGAPRTATVVAASPCRYLAGDRHALHHLLSAGEVRARVRRLVSTRLAEDLKPVPARLPGGERLYLRPLVASDRNALDDALHSLSRETIRRRFFTSSAPSEAVVDYLVDLDYVDHFAWTAMDGSTRTGIAVARYVRPGSGPAAETAFTTVDGYQGKGVGTLMLGVVGVTALQAGIEELVGLVLEDNVAMRRVFAKAGARSRFDEPGVLRVSVDPGQAAALIDGELAVQIAEAVRDVVTAATLALT